ncbi:glucose dehydrogenase [FAD, quinone] [Dermacentor silvarum]|uniref:glucose dehydrogenase [FAD, quinone] n=1 Tax=Dermacentor silvarum TaxID=543639 RepID=UPI00210130F6|nr:glucose dehydrogenase [FAD, quinone] [Dermacentor silvarum]
MRTHKLGTHRTTTLTTADQWEAMLLSSAPNIIVSENGPAFTSSQYADFLNRNGISRMLISQLSNKQQRLWSLQELLLSQNSHQVSPTTELSDPMDSDNDYTVVEGKRLKRKYRRTTKDILFDGMRAVGVTFKKNQRKHTVRAAKEIIVSAGVINSPKLLMLSGVGPKKHLEEMNIPVVADLPVGENLQDHALAAGSLVHLNESLGEGFTGVRGAIEYYRYNTGPWTLPGGIEGIAFYKTKYADQNDDFPDIEIMLNTGPPASSYTEPFLIGLGLKQEVYDKYILPHRGEPAVNMIPFVTRPKSRGYVKLRSTDPEDPPIIVSGYYTHPDDVKVIVEGLKFVHNITKTKAFAEIGGRMWTEVFPGCEEHEQYSDEYWACLALAFPKTAYHPAGTCRMGNDHRAVIDPRMRVRGGVTNLRVVDTSAIPEMITGHLNAPVIMMAEKAADMILEDNGNVVPDSPRLNYRVRGRSPQGSQQGAHSAAAASTLSQAAPWPLLRAMVPVLLACLAVS